MKKILFILIIAFTGISIFGQATNKQIKARAGITIGDERVSGTDISVIDSLTIEGTTVHMYNGATDLTLGIGGSSFDSTYIHYRVDSLVGVKVNIADTAAMLTPYIERKDTATMLTPYSLTSETFSVADATDLGTVVPLQSDTTTLFVWSVGIGAAGDTANFRTLVTHGYDYGGFWWGGSDTLVVTKLIGVTSTGGNLAIQVSWDVNYLDATPTNLNTSPPAITSTTSGDSDTSFDNAEIPPGVWVWLTTPTVTAQPKKLRVSVIGYKRNLSY